MNLRSTLLSIFLICTLYGSLGCVSAMEHSDNPSAHHHEVSTNESGDCHTNQNNLLALSDDKLALSYTWDISEDIPFVSLPYVFPDKIPVVLHDANTQKDYLYKDHIPILTVRLIL